MWKSAAENVWKAITRKRQDYGIGLKSLQSKQFNLFDLLALGAGPTLGIGLYVLTGNIALVDAGPAVIFSFIIAGFAAALAAACYVEFAARVPKAKSAYIFSYVTIGELAAFTVGWNIISECVVGSAAVARGFSDQVDYILSNNLSDYFAEIIPVDIEYFSSYLDFFAFGVVILVTLALAAGLQQSLLMFKCLTFINLATILIVIIAGSTQLDRFNWGIWSEDIPEGIANSTGPDGGEGEFYPYGYAGVITGAAKFFFAFVGFDRITTTGQELQNDKRSWIPLATVLSFTMIFVANGVVACIVTLMWPYYLQSDTAPILHVFEQFQQFKTIKWFVSIGALFALSSSLLALMFQLPKILVSMSTDGMLFGLIKKVNNKTKSPIFAVIIFGLFAAALSLIFDVEQLVQMMNICSLMTYTVVAVCIIVLHYDAPESAETHGHLPGSVFKSICKHPGKSCKLTAKIVKQCVILFWILATIFAIMLLFIEELNYLAIAATFTFACLFFITITICFQPKDSSKKLYYKVPLVPFLPCVSIMLNMYLMVNLSDQTWYRFIVWMIIGYLIYFLYGIKNSEERKTEGSNANDNNLDGNRNSKENSAQKPPKLLKVEFKLDGENVKKDTADKIDEIQKNAEKVSKRVEDLYKLEDLKKMEEATNV